MCHVGRFSNVSSLNVPVRYYLILEVQVDLIALRQVLTTIYSISRGPSPLHIAAMVCDGGGYSVSWARPQYVDTAILWVSVIEVMAAKASMAINIKTYVCYIKTDSPTSSYAGRPGVIVITLECY